MNYWVERNGRVHESETIGWHGSFCYEWLKNASKQENKKYEKWDSENRYRFVHEYFEEVKGWVRYCGWGTDPGWVFCDTARPTRAQIHKMFLLTKHVYE